MRTVVYCSTYTSQNVCHVFFFSFCALSQVEISFYLLRRLLGVKTQEGGKQAKVQKLQRQEILMVNIGSTASGGKVLAVKQVRACMNKVLPCG